MLLRRQVVSLGILAAWGVLSCVWVGAEGVRVEVEVSPDQFQGWISPYIFGAGIEAKTNPRKVPQLM